MAELAITTKFTGALQVFDTASSASNRPDNTSLSFTSDLRIENQVREILASGTLSVTAAGEGLTSVQLIKLEVVTPGQSVTVKFNGDPNGFSLTAASVTDKAFLIASADFTSLDIVNPDVANSVKVSFSFFKKQ